ncbi:hypothetical protein JCM10207_006469 [Rhodosporidiobolus poonsookiae]
MALRLSIKDRRSKSASLDPQPALSSSTEERRGTWRQLVFVCLLILLTIKASSWLRGAASSTLGFGSGASSASSKTDQLPHITLQAYLRQTARARIDELQPHLWLTTADRRTISTAAGDLNERVRQLNQQGEGPIELVVLCGDRDCLETCMEMEGFRCYGDYAGTNPAGVKIAPWMIVSGISDALSTGRNVLYLDAAVLLTSAPHRFLDQDEGVADIVAVPEPDPSLIQHIGTDLVWSRSTPASTELWKSVKEALSAGEAKIEDVLNSMLKPEEEAVGETRRSWKSVAGVQVRLLNFKLFTAWRPRMAELKQQPVAFQLACAGDKLYRSYLANFTGFSAGGDSHYSNPPKILQLERSLVGTRAEVKHLLKVAIAAAILSGRALQPPATVTFLDAFEPSSEDPLTLPVAEAFPLPYLAAALNFHLVEPSYTSHALSALRELSTNSSSLSYSTTVQLVFELSSPSELDLRGADSLPDLVHRLTMLAYTAERVVRLTHATAPSATWREWILSPQALSVVQPCGRLELPPTCGEVCRVTGPLKRGITKEEWRSEDAGALVVREMKKRISEPFPSLADFLTS